MEKIESDANEKFFSCDGLKNEQVLKIKSERIFLNWSVLGSTDC